MVTKLDEHSEKEPVAFAQDLQGAYLEVELLKVESSRN